MSNLPVTKEDTKEKGEEMSKELSIPKNLATSYGRPTGNITYPLYGAGYGRISDVSVAGRKAAMMLARQYPNLKIELRGNTDGLSVGGHVDEGEFHFGIGAKKNTKNGHIYYHGIIFGPQYTYLETQTTTPQTSLQFLIHNLKDIPKLRKKFQELQMKKVKQ